ncbi:MAG: iron-sulfur cluster carrier protein ApbC [Paraglaciecola sp.]|nr:iron-sulfur cluster carrier protein ApbC [Paraglaciecola sp.]
MPTPFAVLTAAQQSTLIACVADFFSLPEAHVKTWLHYATGKVEIHIPFAALSEHSALLTAVRLALGETHTQVISLHTRISSAPTSKPKLATINNLVAVASGKGGVGKSSTAVNLAFALAAEGARVGILDADIYGPSIPMMLGNPQAKPSSQDQKRVDPLEVHGVFATSIGYFVPAEHATIWRGPMASKALMQLLNETHWPSLDYLIVDMPPGTGDIQLTLAELLPVSGALIVTTPQDLALADASKGIAMFNKVKVPVLGLIENMSYHVCSQCGHHEAIFAEHGADKLAAQYHLPVLAQLPLDIVIRQQADSGVPLQIAQPQHAISSMYRQLARQVSRQLHTSHT